MNILIDIEGGIIQHIKGIPPGACVIIRDYDVEDFDPEDLELDENNTYYRLIVWWSNP